MEAHARDTVEHGFLDERVGSPGRSSARPAPDERKRARGRRPGDPAARLDHYLPRDKAVVLHHRRLPSSGAEISHLIVGPAGVTVVDSRKYAGRRVRLNGAVRIGLRDRSDLIDRLVAQANGVRELLAGTPYADVPVEAALARRKVEGVPIVPNPDTRIIVCGTRRIAGEASRPGPLSRNRVNALAAYLDRDLPAL
jgi:hypothetical protein